MLRKAAMLSYNSKYSHLLWRRELGRREICSLYEEKILYIEREKMKVENGEGEGNIYMWERGICHLIDWWWACGVAGRISLSCGSCPRKWKEGRAMRLLMLPAGDHERKRPGRRLLAWRRRYPRMRHACWRHVMACLLCIYDHIPCLINMRMAKAAHCCLLCNENGQCNVVMLMVSHSCNLCCASKLSASYKYHIWVKHRKEKKINTMAINLKYLLSCSYRHEKAPLHHLSLLISSLCLSPNGRRRRERERRHLDNHVGSAEKRKPAGKAAAISGKAASLIGEISQWREEKSGARSGHSELWKERNLFQWLSVVAACRRRERSSVSWLFMVAKLAAAWEEKQRGRESRNGASYVSTPCLLCSLISRLLSLELIYGRSSLKLASCSHPIHINRREKENLCCLSPLKRHQ